MSKINKIWHRIESHSKEKSGFTRKLVKKLENGNCYLGYIPVTDVRMFQIELRNNTIVSPKYLRKFKGIEIQVLPKNDMIKEFTIILLEKDLADIFTFFVEDLLEKLEFNTKDEEILTVINKRVNYWKRLFAHITGEILSPKKQRGLYGELFVLHKLLKTDLSKETILASWQGANNANQDFAYNENAIEVKTSKAGNPSVHIASEHQLDYTTWNNLYLSVILVNESAGHQNSLSALIKEIHKLLDFDSGLLNTFNHKLDLAGISMDMIDYYNKVTYTIRNHHFFRVGEGFPILTKNTINNEAICNVKYQIDLDTCMQFEIHEKDVLNSLS